MLIKQRISLSILLIIIIGLSCSHYILKDYYVKTDNLGNTVYGENLSIFYIYNSVYWQISSFYPEVSLNKILSINYLRENNIKRIIWTLVTLKNWRQNYNYFIENIYFNNTNLYGVYEDVSTIRIIFSDKVKLEIVREIAYNFSFLLHAAYVFLNTSSIPPYVTLISPINITYHKDYIEDSIPLNFTGLLSLIDNYDQLFDQDYLNITVILDPTASPHYKLFISAIRHIPMDEREFFSLSNIFPNIENAVTRRDIHTTRITLYMKDIYLISKPENLSVRYLPSINTFILSKELPNATKIGDIKIKMQNIYPTLLIDKNVNGNIASGNNITIQLNIKNIGSIDALNITVVENNWWGKYNFTLLSNKHTWAIDEIKAGNSYTINYVVNIGILTNNMCIIIPQTKVYVNMPGDVTLNFSSSQINIHIINGNVSIINADIKELSIKHPSIVDSPSYYLSISNQGNLSIRDLTTDEIYVYLIHPGKSVNLPMKSIASLRDNLLSISHIISYRIERSIYTLRSPCITILFKLDTSSLPYVNVNLKSTRIDDSQYNLTMTIINKGPYDITNFKLIGILTNNLTYVSGDYRLSQDNIISFNSSLPKGQEVFIKGIFHLNPNTSSITPRFTLTLMNEFGMINYLPRTMPILNSVYCSVLYPPKILLKNLGYNLSIILRNHSPMPIYNIHSLVNVSKTIYMNTTSKRIDSLSTDQELKFTFNFTPISKGNITINYVKVFYVYSGYTFMEVYQNYSMVAVQGLTVNIEYQSELTENQPLIVNITIVRDSELISNITLYWKLPPNLVFHNGEDEVTLTREFTDDELLVTLRIDILTPDRYAINPPEIYFSFMNNKYSISDLGIKISGIHVNVKENIVMRYMIYFIPILALTIAAALYIRIKLKI